MRCVRVRCAYACVCVCVPRGSKGVPRVPRELPGPAGPRSPQDAFLALAQKLIAKLTSPPPVGSWHRADHHTRHLQITALSQSLHALATALLQDLSTSSRSSARCLASSTGAPPCHRPALNATTRRPSAFRAAQTHAHGLWDWSERRSSSWSTAHWRRSRASRRSWHHRGCDATRSSGSSRRHGVQDLLWQVEVSRLR